MPNCVLPKVAAAKLTEYGYVVVVVVDAVPAVVVVVRLVLVEPAIVPAPELCDIRTVAVQSVA